MGADTIAIYAITADVPRSQPDGLGDRPRVEMGKFFRAEDAENHAASMRGRLANVRIEQRSEARREQHESHR